MIIIQMHMGMPNCRLATENLDRVPKGQNCFEPCKGLPMGTYMGLVTVWSRWLRQEVLRRDHVSMIILKASPPVPCNYVPGIYWRQLWGLLGISCFMDPLWSTLFKHQLSLCSQNDRKQRETKLAGNWAHSFLPVHVKTSLSGSRTHFWFIFVKQRRLNRVITFDHIISNK